MEEVTKVLPAIALRGTTILPDMIVHFDISRPKSRIRKYRVCLMCIKLEQLRSSNRL